MKVYVSKDGQQYGPYTVEQLRMYVQQGNFLTGDYACFDGQNWVTIADVPGFAAGGDSMTTPQQSQAVQEQAASTDTSYSPSKKKKIILWTGIGGVATLLVASLLLWLLGGDEPVQDMQDSEDELIKTSHGWKSELTKLEAQENEAAKRGSSKDSTSTTETQIVCDKFELLTKVSGSTLDLSIDTDLPDNTVVMVGVSRTYTAKDNADTYPVDYLSEKSTIGKWKSTHSISIASDGWKTDLMAKQKEMSRLGLGFDVAFISDKITVGMVVPINQPDPKFGSRNANLTGKAVRKTGIRVVEDEIEVDYPLNAPPSWPSPSPSLNPQELEIGQVYVVSRETPLMPSHPNALGVPDDVLGTIQRMKQIPKGGGFKVLEVKMDKTDTWYKVNAFDLSRPIGTGWINSIALLGQELDIPKASP